MANDAPILELKVPKSIGAVIRTTVLTTIILFFIFLAIYNLFNSTATIPSIIWLLLVAFIFWDSGKSKGYKQFAIEILGAFSLKEFVQTIRRENGHNEIQFGCQMFGRRFLYLTVATVKIDHVNWKTGQATDMAKRDMNDWSVLVWYNHGDSVKSQKRAKRPHPNQDLYIVGPPGRRKEIETFGLVFIEFLRKSGVTIVQGNNKCTFVRQLTSI